MTGATNERLRTAMDRAGYGSQKLARLLGVDVKTVTRWVTTGRCPHPSTGEQAAKILNADPAYLWPGLYDRRTTGAPRVVPVTPREELRVDQLQQLVAQLRYDLVRLSDQAAALGDYVAYLTGVTEPSSDRRLTLVPTSLGDTA